MPFRNPTGEPCGGPIPEKWRDFAVMKGKEDIVTNDNIGKFLVNTCWGFFEGMITKETHKTFTVHSNLWGKRRINKNKGLYMFPTESLARTAVEAFQEVERAHTPICVQAGRALAEAKENRRKASISALEKHGGKEVV